MPVSAALPAGPFTPGAGTPAPDVSAVVAFLREKGNATDAELAPPPGALNVRSPTFGPGNGVILPADGAAHPLSGYFATLAAAQAVYPFVTALTQQLAFAAIQKALNSAKASRGSVFVPQGAGLYYVNDELTIALGVTLFGEGMVASRLFWQTDLGAGKYGIKRDGGPTGGGVGFGPRFRDIEIQGPGAGSVYGTQAVFMSGAHSTTGEVWDRVRVAGFGSGVAIDGNHSRFTDCSIEQNFYNVHFVPTTVGWGNIIFDGCLLQSGRMASVAASGTGKIDGCSFVNRCYVGGSPYGFYKFGDTTGAAFINGCTMTDIDFEWCGNAAILDESTSTGVGGSIQDTLIRSSFSWNTAFRIAARHRNYALDLRYCKGLTLEATYAPFETGDIAVISETGNGPLNTVRYLPTPIATFLKPEIAGGALQWRIDIPTLQAAWIPLTSESAIVTGDILEMWTSSNAHRFTTGQFLGVALHAAALSKSVWVAFPGSIAKVLCEPVGLGGRLISTGGGGVAYRGMDAPNLGAAPAAGNPSNGTIIGAALNAGGAAGGALLDVLLQAPVRDPFYLKPQSVGALPAASVTWRGVELRVQGGAGVADLAYRCEKNTADAYVWRAF